MTSILTSGYERVPYTQRPFTHPLAQEIAQIMEEKKTNICFSADVDSIHKVIDLLKRLGPHIAILKTHLDIYNDCTLEKIQELKNIAKEVRVILFEDRKFVEIGHIVKKQYTEGPYRIAEHFPLTNLTITSGLEIVDALKEGVIETAQKVDEASQNGFLLVAEMSSKGNSFNQFLNKTLLAARTNRDVVIGYICQRSFGDSAFLYMVPGVNATRRGDHLGQQYRTPKDVIVEGADVIIVGRGISESTNPEEAAKEYQETAWKAHTEALGMILPKEPKLPFLIFPNNKRASWPLVKNVSEARL